MTKINNYTEPKEGKPFIWGWDDGSIYFSPDGSQSAVSSLKIQDHPELLARVVAACSEYYAKAKGQQQ